MRPFPARFPAPAQTASTPAPDPGVPRRARLATAMLLLTVFGLGAVACSAPPAVSDEDDLGPQQAGRWVAGRLADGDGAALCPVFSAALQQGISTIGVGNGSCKDFVEDVSKRMFPKVRECLQEPDEIEPGRNDSGTQVEIVCAGSDAELTIGLEMSPPEFKVTDLSDDVIG